MRNLITLVWQDLQVQNKIFHVMRSNFQFLLLSIICVALVYHKRGHDLAEHALLFSIISIPIAMVISARPIIRHDINDGTLDLLLMTVGSDHVIISKFICLFLNLFIAFLLSLPFTVLLYDLALSEVFYSITSRFFVLIQVAAVALLIGCIESYFRNYTEIISAIAFPMIMPSIIISGMMIHDRTQDFFYLSLLFGVDLVLIPVTLFLASYLVSHIHDAT